MSKLKRSMSNVEKNTLKALDNVGRKARSSSKREKREEREEEGTKSKGDGGVSAFDTWAPKAAKSSGRSSAAPKAVETKASRSRSSAGAGEKGAGRASSNGRV